MAIAFDATDTGGLVNPGTSLTWSHTCTGSNRLLLVGVIGPSTGADVITGVTYAGVAMTLVTKVRVPTNTFMYVFSLANPATGANNVVVSASASVLIGGYGNSYTGCSGAIDNHTTNTVTPATSLATSLTTVADNCWTLIMFRSSSGTMSVGSGFTNRPAAQANGFLFGDSNAVKTPPGSVSMTGGNSASASLATIMISFSPFVPVVASGQMIDLLL